MQRTGVALVLLAVAVAACAGPREPGKSPAALPVIGMDWATVPDVERPSDTIASAQPSQLPHGSDTAGHPGHPAGQAHLQAVARGGPGLVAVGHVVPGVRAAAWTSVDGLAWRRVPDFPVANDSPLLAVAAGPGGTPVVAVGTENGLPLALVSDGATWQKPPFVVDDLREPIQVAAVAAGAGGFAAGGWAGASNERPDTRIWY